MPAIPHRRSYALPRPRRVKMGFVKGALYCRIVEYLSDGRERTIAWLGRSPSEVRIKKAARLFGAKLPRQRNNRQEDSLV